MDRFLEQRLPALIRGGVADERTRAEEVPRERDPAMVVMHAEAEGVRQRIFLRLKTIAGDLFGEFLHVHRYRLETDRAERLRVKLAHLRADREAFAVGGGADRPHLVRNMPE